MRPAERAVMPGRRPTPADRAAGLLLAVMVAGLAVAARPAAAQGVAAIPWSALTSLTPEQARGWAALENLPRESTLDGTWHTLDKVGSLSPEAAAELVKPKRQLSLNGLTELSPEIAAILARHPAAGGFGSADLRLNGLKGLSPEAAEALAAHEGKVLLYGLERLDSVPLARKLARQWGELRLGVTQLSPEIAAELAKHRGTEEDKTRPGLVLRRQDGAASVLRLDNIRSLSVEAAEALAAHEGVLVLNGLESLVPAVAAALARRTGNAKTNRPGTLVLNGLPAISPEAATALAAFPGELVLKAITELSSEGAAALARHKGRLHLTGLERISPAALESLRGHPNVLLPRPLPPAPAG